VNVNVFGGRICVVASKGVGEVGMKRYILFVDDEPNILAGLRNRLHRLQRKWDMAFAQSGAEALEHLANNPVDVIVTDMRMPRMDGAALLTEVQRQYPRVVRIVLSGHAEMETALRAVPVAHQFLSKPSEAGAIEEVVERACNLQSLINDELIQRAIGKIDKLPTSPRVYNKLVAELTNESASVDGVARILHEDMAMCAKILQMVNSAFFRLSRKVVRMEEAVSYLGFNTVKHVVLAVEVFQNSERRTKPPLSLEVLQRHALSVASLAATFFTGKQLKEDAFVAGLLHDIGKLVLLTELPEKVAQVAAEMKSSNSEMHVAEKNVLGVTHAEVGAYLLGLWGLPYPIVEAVADHHAVQRVQSKEFGLLAATHIADQLINEAQWQEYSSGYATHGPPAPIDGDYLTQLGVANQMSNWRQTAEKLANAGPK
jgi:putative nucleotidyltransferase with HDIG domain